ncbi:MAG: nucleotide-binding universal stress UspA family protein [Myxococcota bacterium]|jgi:nucleotide-binding universal stress UspA family protein
MLIAVDVHDRPDDVLRAALPWARTFKRRVDLAFASEWSTEDVTPPHPTPELEARIAEWSALAAGERVALDELVARVPEAYRGRGVFLSGRAIDVLPDATRPTGITVVATHGRGLVGRALLGSVSARLIRAAQGPVLVLHLDEAESPAAPPTVVVPIDLDHGASALRQVAELLPQASFRLVNVLPMPGWSGVFSHEDDARAALRTLARAESLVDAEVTVLPPARRPGDAIAAFATRAGADLIALPTRGRTGVTRWALGSVTERVVHVATMPVLVTRLRSPD